MSRIGAHIGSPIGVAASAVLGDSRATAEAGQLGALKGYVPCPGARVGARRPEYRSRSDASLVRRPAVQGASTGVRPRRART